MSMRWLAMASFIVSLNLHAAPAQRVVIIKADGVPAHVLDSVIKDRNPATGKSILPWIDYVFYQHGARVANYYTRGISLSAPAWSLLDTGRPLQIRGNVEFDRYTFRIYDYLNFFPFYLNYALSRRVDMPGVEVLDNAGTPLFIDSFGYTHSYQSFQLYQRGVRWTTLQRGLQRHFSGRSLRDLLDEWEMGLELDASVGDETERELIEKLNNPEIKYLDFFTGEFDHVAHSVRDLSNQRRALEELDGLVGRLWTAIQKAPLASSTLLVLVSDHGMNTDPTVYSQGYSLVEWFNSPAGGSHHVVTNRHPLSDFKVKGLDPFVSRVVTPSDTHPYLRDEADDYPTVLLDLDGNERASIHFRNSDLNRIHVLLRQAARNDIGPALRGPAIREVQRIIEEHRAVWQATITSLNEELAAVRRVNALLRTIVAAQPKKKPKQWSAAELAQGLDKDARRLAAHLEEWEKEERAYAEYVHSLEALLAFKCDRCEPSSDTIARLIPPRSMGDLNTIEQLRHYVIGPAQSGLALTPDGVLDPQKSFRTVDYLAGLRQIQVRNNVQPSLSPSPVDFIAMRLPRSQLRDLAPADQLTRDAVWIYRSDDSQALLLARAVPGDVQQIRYLAIANLQQDREGQFHWITRTPGPGFPLDIWEDIAFNVEEDQRTPWLSAWHSEREWMAAIHETTYSNAVVGLLEHFGPVEVGPPPVPPGTPPDDVALFARWQARRRALVEPELLVLANNHWNFNVRSFNPGGNHGSFFRPSTHGIWLLNGAGIKPQVISEPCDSLTFLPTLRQLLGVMTKDSEAAITARPLTISTSRP